MLVHLLIENCNDILGKSQMTSAVQQPRSHQAPQRVQREGEGLRLSQARAQETRNLCIASVGAGHPVFSSQLHLSCGLSVATASWGMNALKRS